MDAQVIKVRPTTIAIVALGGEGGGVLADWIVDVAHHSGYLAQATSVPGVAQRTGATVYYLELFPETAARAAGRPPVLGLLPMPGDVDVVLASELMEAARAVERGFVTPDKTLLITSTHRVYAMTERIALADGREDSAALFAACRESAGRLICFDMAALADATQSVLSAVLFGALAGAGVLPFARGAFEAAIRRGGVGVKSSLAAFAAGFEAAKTGAATGPAAPVPSENLQQGSAVLRTLTREAAQDYSGEARGVVAAAVDRLCDYQDADYAREFLKLLEPVRDLEQRRGDGSHRLLVEVARQLALGMAYEDTIRVAELKCRRSRFARVRDEVEIAPGQVLRIAEFFHPRVQEIADTLPAAAGHWLMRTDWARRLVERGLRRGKVIETTSLRGFLLLYTLTLLKPLRRRSLRFAREQARLTAWLDLVATTADSDWALAVEIARMRNLVKGYGDTLERGVAKFEKLADVLPRLHGGENAATLLRGLIKAATADEEGRALDQALAALPSAQQPCSLSIGSSAPRWDARSSDPNPPHPQRGPTMAYDLDQFVSDCRSILKRDPGPSGREEVRTRLESLLSNESFVEEHCGEHVPRGLKVLYEDAELGFQILAHINDKARVSPPHDHGASWAIYGQATHYTDMTEWEREDNGAEANKAKLKPVKKYRLLPGHAGIYQDGTIHSIDYPDSSRFVRVTGTNLDNIQRVSFDLATGKVNQMTPQQAT